MKKTFLFAWLTALVLLVSLILSSCNLIETVFKGNQNTESDDSYSDDGPSDTENDLGGEENTSGQILLALSNKDRYTVDTSVDKVKAEEAMERVIAKLRENIDEFSNAFPSPGSTNFQYTTSSTVNWTSGMMTGMYWMAYEYTGDEVFKEAAERQIEVYKRQSTSGNYLRDHDTGFKYSLSCVAGYKLTGDKSMRTAALNAAEVLLDHYDWDNHFIIRWEKRDPNNYEMYRTLVDSMMNIQLFFFAYEETGEQKFYDAAVGHYRTTLTYLVRADGSSYHHYQFDPVTGKPVGGVTWQGNSNESCWTRGHAWLIYGFPLAYSYTENEDIIENYGKIASFYLNHLPSDNVPYWDFDFSDGSSEPKDTSAAAIAICGFLEMCEYLPNDLEQKKIFSNAAAAQMNVLLENYQNTRNDADGLLLGVTYAKPQGQGIEECAVFGDYFYMEALMRYLNPNFVRYW